MLRLKTLGGLSIESDRGPLNHVPEQRRRMALLALLMVPRYGSVSRDKIIGYLWPESDEGRARHALAQALHALRRDLGCDALVIGTAELRLNPEVITSDAGEFETALDHDEPARAVALYGGPFLDGFHINSAPEFGRWTEAERTRLGCRHRAALELLAMAAEGRADFGAAANWWRRVAELDPLDSRSAFALMCALARAGDRPGALRYAHVHEALLRQELDMAPDPAIAALAARLRAESAAPQRDQKEHTPAPDAGAYIRVDQPSDAAAPSSAAPVNLAVTAVVPTADNAAPRRDEEEDGHGATPSSLVPPARATSSRTRWRVIGAVAAGVAAVGVGTALARRSRPDTAPVLAVGTIRDFSAGDTSGLARALGDMLATNLTRVAGLEVVSNARVYELLGQIRGGQQDGDRAAAAIATAARAAGATELVEGALFRRTDGTLRLDLRRVALSSGAHRAAYTVEGADPYTLADRATAELASSFAVRSETLRVADVTTRSLTAYRLYEEGLRAWYHHNDAPAAHRLFTAALAEDSTFAMAAYYAYLVEITLKPLSSSEKSPYLAQAMRMADRATDRERLMLRAAWLQTWLDATQLAVAETLVARYPTEPDGHYWLGRGLMWSGDFLGALPHLRLVVAMDSLSLRGESARCRACDAVHSLIEAYLDLDSLAAAERVAREYARVRPRVADPWALLYDVYVAGGRYEDAQAVRGPLERLQPSTPDARAFALALIALRKGDLKEADRLLALLRQDTSSVLNAEGTWYGVISLRYQGRLREALEMAGPNGAGMAAQVLHEQGRWREAAALFDSMAQHPSFDGSQRGRVARHRAWYLTHSATALAAAGDTGRLETLADSVEAIGEQSAYGRDRRLHYHIRGLLHAARGNWKAAEDAFRRALYSPTAGYTRTNLELARSLLAQHRPSEAASILRPALRGPLEASNLYVTHTELHELLARACDEAGQLDSAAVHYRWVVNAWRGADPQLRLRREAARRRLAALGR